MYMQQTKDSPLPNRSRFTIVVTPGIEKLVMDATQLRLKEGPNLNQSIISLSQLIDSLANQPFPHRVITYR